ncbi:hypothetical protein LINPERPRIM_LOCUS29856 [Linum perenne]
MSRKGKAASTPSALSDPRHQLPRRGRDRLGSLLLLHHGRLRHLRLLVVSTFLSQLFSEISAVKIDDPLGTKQWAGKALPARGGSRTKRLIRTSTTQLDTFSTPLSYHMS